MAMASPQQIPSATQSSEATPQEAQALQPDSSSLPPPAVSRRVQELRDPKSSSHKRPKTRSTEAASKDPRRTQSHRWRQDVISVLDAGESFSTRIKIFKILGRIPELRGHIPQLLSNNPVDRTYTIQYTRRELVQFEDEARWIHLQYYKIQQLKRQLFGFIRLMYKNGVRYNLYPQNLYLYKPVSYLRARELFLGSVEDSDLLDKENLDWDKQKERLWDHINRIFAPFEIWTYQEEAASLAASVKEQTSLVESTINDNNIAIDAAKADLMEARAIMAGALQIIKEGCATIEGLKAVTKNLEASVIRPHRAWDGAQLGKEYVETGLKKIDALAGRKNALIQKYGGPKPNDGVSTGSTTSGPSIQPDEKVSTMKTTNSPIDDATTKDGTSTDDAGSKEDDGLGT